MKVSAAQHATHQRRVRAEAANWVAYLHSPQRNAEVEGGLKRWLSEDPAHATAFELATDKWDQSAGLSGGLPDRSLWGATQPRPATLWLKSALACAFALMVIGIALYVRFNDGIITTAIGEQRTVNLSDGTRVELNTHTTLRVRYDDHERKVILESGEAYFDVAKHQRRPFVVYAGQQKIIALGTTFVVRTDLPDAAQPELAVTLIEGRVAVAPIGVSDAIPQQPPHDVNVMSAGQRLTLSKINPPKIDLPSVDRVTAWQRGQLVFEATPLLEAAAEFNRYSSVRITVDDPRAANLRIGGAFRIGDALAFAQAMAESHHLRLTHHGRDIFLTPLP